MSSSSNYLPLDWLNELAVFPLPRVVFFPGTVLPLHIYEARYRALFGYRHYRHDELVGETVVTEFENNTSDDNLQAKHRPIGRMTGTIG